ncbi:MAG: choice-of-anchor B family protein [Crocinitomicaceae bacterium]|nr:choice-of-anchor B family protein [Crocinitomicaceae bacterium]
MRKLLASLLLTLLSVVSFSQVNMDLLGFMDIPTLHGTQLNDIWGYTDEFGNEYALIGTNDGVSVVDVTDPSNLTEIAWFPGMNSVWRDIKVYDDYAYITTEAMQGLQIIDLSPLPGSTSLPTSTYFGPGGNQWQSAHNLYQADGYVYIFGANRDNGGIIILDVATNPMNPVEVGSFEQWYCHDGFVRNDTGYFSHVNDGFFTIMDLTDKANLSVTDVIGSLATTNNFTHNCWPSDDGQALFTTDEVANGFLGSYDISDPANPVFLDQIQSNPGNNIIPHNAHVLNNYLITSYYTDGVVVHDISDPSNMVEVGYYDTSPNYNGGTFNGCWGVYPFFGSGNIIASDTEEGLYVLGLNPTLSCYLEGKVTNAGTNQPINNASIEILTTAITDNTDAIGEYSIGTTNTGMYQVRYSAPGFYADTFDIDFVSGIIITQNVALEQIPLFTATITVIDATTLQPVENAHVLIEHTNQFFEELTDANGEATFGLFYEDNYNITAGKWLYNNDCDAGQSLTVANNTHTMEIDSGLYDDFTFDYGWTTFGTATSGFWAREIPVGTQSAGQTGNPFVDDLYDCSSFAFATGNGAQTIGGDDIDGGSVELKSPVFDLTNYMSPRIDFSYWFFNGFGSGNANDSLAIYLSNGSVVWQVASLGSNNATMSQWTTMSILVSDFMTPTDQMQLTFLASDFSPGHVMEAGVDHFRVEETVFADVSGQASESISLYPNPATNEINITGVQTGTLTVFDLSGRVVLQQLIQPTLDVSSLQSGMYIFQITDLNGAVLKIQKQQIR